MIEKQTIGRILAIDPGEVRTGLALSDPLGITGQPLEVLSPGTGKKALARLVEIVAEFEVAKIIMGLPLNMNGSEGPQAQKARTFGEKIAARTRLEVIYWDERLTSIEAEKTLIKGEMRREKRKTKIDTMAAQIILGSYLDYINHE